VIAQTVADENEVVAPAQAAHKNTHPVLPAASDAEPAAGIRVIDDLPRPVPVLQREGEIVRKLLGARFRQIMLEEEKP